MDPRVVSRSKWLAQRVELLEKEKAFTRNYDALVAQRQSLPWVLVEKDYVFDTERGEESLAALFNGCDQLLVYHFMFGLDWEQGCPSCSFWADTYNGVGPHLRARNTALVAVSNAPLARLLEYRTRMGWDFDWVSAGRNSFSTDFAVTFVEGDQSDNQRGYNYSNAYREGEHPGISVFHRLGDGGVAHSYSCFGRGLEAANGAYHMLDMTPRGRDEAGLPFPMQWVRRRDEY